jgi:hypothetical protein
MKRFFKLTLIIVCVLVALFVIGGYMIPSHWSVSKSITINAPSDEIYPHLADLRNWQNWSPWTKEKDPTQVYTYEGPEVGPGAKWLWTSEKMGKGVLEIKKADPAQGISYELFIDMNDMQTTIEGDMSFRSHDGMTEVNWTDSGNSGNLIKRWMSLFIGSMLGGEMESGLTKLKELVEKK